MEDNNKDNLKPFRAVDASAANKPKSRLSPDAQRVILENVTVNRIQGDIDYANAFLDRLGSHCEWRNIRNDRSCFISRTNR
jgi:hypothetical protein